MIALILIGVIIFIIIALADARAYYKLKMARYHQQLIDTQNAQYKADHRIIYKRRDSKD